MNMIKLLSIPLVMGLMILSGFGVISSIIFLIFGYTVLLYTLAVMGMLFSFILLYVFEGYLMGKILDYADRPPKDEDERWGSLREILAWGFMTIEGIFLTIWENHKERKIKNEYEKSQ